MRWHDCVAPYDVIVDVRLQPAVGNGLRAIPAFRGTRRNATEGVPYTRCPGIVQGRLAGMPTRPGIESASGPASRSRSCPGSSTIARGCRSRPSTSWANASACGWWPKANPHGSAPRRKTGEQAASIAPTPARPRMPLIGRDAPSRGEARQGPSAFPRRTRRLAVWYGCASSGAGTRTPDTRIMIPLL